MPEIVDTATPPTRLIAMGGEELTLGFRLIGFEIYPGASTADLDRLLGELIARRETALVLLDPELAHTDSPTLQRVRGEGGHIVVTEMPALSAPQDYHPDVEDVVRSVLGPGALEDLA